jgi:ribonuclease HII
MLIAGVDEAGRGPCLGPLVIAAATIEKGDEELLVQRGVTDSKLLSRKKREELFGVVHKLCSNVAVESIGPEELDSLMLNKSLNEIEAMRAGKALNSLPEKPDVVYVDSPDFISDNFAKRIMKYITFKPVIVSEHKADLNYPVAGAASIVAKVTRDRNIEELCGSYGNLGSGYTHDERTISFIKKFLYENNKLPPFVRKSWLTTERILNEKYQKKLFDGGWSK